VDLPQEIEVWYVIPALRRELALELKKLGLSQKKIAIRLKLSEASVSHYMQRRRGSTVLFPPKIRSEIAKSAASIAHGASVPEQVVRLTQLVRQEKLLCSIHKQHGAVPKNCRICLQKTYKQ
jgi:predicted transcriptional regulator